MSLRRRYFFSVCRINNNPNLSYIALINIETMNKYIIILFFSLFATSCANSQNILTTQSTVATEIPKQAFATYWQQQVDYTMDIDMDVKNYQYKGSQKLVYTNNSPNELHKVYYHLYFNAFQPGSQMDARLHSIVDPDKRMVTNIGSKNHPVYKSRIDLLKPNEIGFIKVHSLTQNGTPLTYHIEGTILEVTLNQPIKSGEKAVFDMDFTGQVPVQIRRSGRNNKGGVALSMAQWYPKLAEYDFEGWHADPYIAREFYGVWGDFDVTIHIDRNYMLGGTGYIQNPQEVGFGYEDKTKVLEIPNTDKLTWHFKAPKVHDFTWVADTNFVHDTQTLKNGTVLHFLYKNEKKIAKDWKKMQPMAVQTMEFYNDYVGEYPYQQYSLLQGGDGGMEYAMCTLISKKQDLNGLLGTMMHEMGHTWFQFMLATNESKHPWMDEGFTSYIEVLASHKIRDNKPNFIFKNSYDYYYYMATTGQEEPLTTHADRYNTNMSYGINAYDKGLVFIAQLEYIIGKENLDKSVKEYFNSWKGKHPSPNDFIRVAEQVSGLELDWYLNEFAQTTHTIDYNIKSVNNNTITLERIGAMPMPIDLFVTYTDGSTEAFYIPLNLMRGEKPTTATILKDWGWAHTTYSFDTTKKIKNIHIDSSQLMADINKENNVWGH